MSQRWIIILLLALGTTLAYLQIQHSSFGRKVDYTALDLWFNIRGEIRAPEEIILASIDEISYQELGVPFNEAWPRELHAQLLQKLSALKVKRVIFDVLFLGMSSDAEADKALSDSMKQVPTVIGADTVLRNIQTAGGISQIEQVLMPAKTFAESAEKIGLVGFKEDSERVRHFYRPLYASVSHMPTLSEAATGVTKNSERPSDNDYIKYYGPGSYIQNIPISEILNGKEEELKELLQDKIVFVGLGLQTQVGPAQKDNYATPFYKGARAYGYEIHATAAANLLHKDWIKNIESTKLSIFFTISAFLLSLLMFSLRPGWTAIILLSVISLWSVIAYRSFLNNEALPGLALTGIVLPIAFVAHTLYYYLYTYSQQRKVERAFQYYLSPNMARQMRTNPEVLKLGGENIFGTALFTDIANFTEISENMLAQDAANMLNRYFTEVMEVIFKKEGTLIKYIGDAVFVIWGAPLKIADHAKRACETALEIQKESEKFNASKRFPALVTRVGVHSGPMLVGNLGSERRFDYTAVGDTINVASRTEGINKYFGTHVLISGSVLKQVKDSVHSIKIGTIKMAGKGEALELHSITEEPLPKEESDLWLESIKLFSLRNWNDAKKGFTKLTAISFFSKAAAFYLKMIEEHLLNEPSPEWRGEIALTSK